MDIIGTPGTGCPNGGLIYWPKLVQPYVKNSQLLLSPGYVFEYDLDAEPNHTPWVCREQNINILANRYMRVSYIMNNIEPQIWDGTPWGDDPLRHWGIRTYWCGNQICVTHALEIVLPSNTIHVLNGHTYGESWGARFTDFLHARGLWPWTGVGKEWSGGRPEIHGIFNNRINILWTDGHVSSPYGGLPTRVNGPFRTTATWTPGGEGKTYDPEKYPDRVGRHHHSGGARDNRLRVLPSSWGRANHATDSAPAGLLWQRTGQVALTGFGA